MTTRFTHIARVAITLSAALGATAWAGSADEAFDAQVQEYRQPLARGEWHNPLMPAGTGQFMAAQGSGDAHLAQVLAGYDRVALDRGGWTNPWVLADHYAAGAPLLAVKVGDGVTTRTAAVASTVDLKVASR
ncbi:MAG: hypothetical protein RIQ60_51 [Pseudomonadota bacterium]|jgi:hypothetical protein